MLRWTLAVALLLEIARAMFWPSGMIYWQGEWDSILRAFSNNSLPLLITPFVIARIVLVIGLLFGFFTRIWAILTVVLAIFSYQTPGQMEHSCLIEYVVVLCGAGLALVVLGGGRGSIDRMISGHLLPRVG